MRKEKSVNKRQGRAEERAKGEKGGRKKGRESIKEQNLRLCFLQSRSS